MWKYLDRALTRNRVGKAVGMFGDQRVLDVPPTNSVCT